MQRFDVSSHDPEPQPFIPPFSRKLEERISKLLAKRLGRPGTEEELANYRQALWAFAKFANSLIEEVKDGTLLWDDAEKKFIRPDPMTAFRPRKRAKQRGKRR